MIYRLPAVLVILISIGVVFAAPSPNAQPDALDTILSLPERANKAVSPYIIARGSSSSSSSSSGGKSAGKAAQQAGKSGDNENAAVGVDIRFMSVVVGVAAAVFVGGMV